MTSTAISHVILAGTGCYCFSRYHGDTLKFPCGTYIIIITNSILGTFVWGAPDIGSKLEGLYNFTTVLQTVNAFPLVATQFLLNSSYAREIAYIPAIASLLPLGMYLMNNAFLDLNDTLLTVETIAVGVISVLRENWYGLGAALLFAVRVPRFGLDNILGLDMPSLDVSNYMLCGFCYCVLRGIS